MGYVGEYKQFCVWTLKFKIRGFGKMMLEKQAVAFMMGLECHLMEWEVMYTCGGLILIFGKSNTVM